MPRTASEWTTTEYTDLRSHTLSTAPVWAQRAYLGLFRPHLVDRIREWKGPAWHARRIVDLGCGTGEWAIDYLDLADEVVGVDVNARFLAEARHKAAADPRAARVRFVEANLLELPDVADADLVCLGACVQYLDDRALDRLLHGLREALAPGASVYVRTTVAAPLRPSRRTDLGHYRTAHYYDERFRRFGFKLADRFRTSSVVPAGLASTLLGIRSFRLARALTAPIWLGHTAWRVLAWPDDFLNWFLTRAAD